MRELLTETEGQNKVIHFWASWCAPCFNEIERAAEVTEALRQDGTAVIYISLDHQVGAWTKASGVLDPFFNSEHQYRFMDRKNEVLKELEINYVSSFVLLDKQGRIRLNPAPTTSDGASIRNVLRKIDRE